MNADILNMNYNVIKYNMEKFWSGAYFKEE